MNKTLRTLALGLTPFALLSLACDSESGDPADDRAAFALTDTLVLVDDGLRSPDGDGLLVEEHLAMTFVESEDRSMTMAFDLGPLVSHLDASKLEFEAIVRRPDGSIESYEVSTDQAAPEIDLSWVGEGHYAIELTRLVVDGELVVDEPFASQGMTIEPMEASMSGPDEVTTQDSAASCPGGSVINGTAFADDLYGTSGEDVINGKAGNDMIWGYECRDVLMGGAGKDTLRGGGGNDDIYGGIQQDILHGGDGDDYLNGEGGSDVCYGGAGTNTFVSCEQIFY